MTPDRPQAHTPAVPSSSAHGHPAASRPPALDSRAAHPAPPAPVGTLGVVAVLLLSISTLWLLVLGILEGRS